MDSTNGFADKLIETIHQKIDKNKGRFHNLHSVVYNNELQREIDTLEWLLKQLKPYTKKDITEERIKAIIAAKVEDLERKMKKASYIWDTDTLFTKAET